MPRCVIMSMEDLLPKEVDSSNQLPACLKMLFLVKIRVAMFPQTLTPLAMQLKSHPPFAFKQVVECVGIFCNCSEHLLAFVLRFEKTTHVMQNGTNWLQDELDLVLPVQGAEETPSSSVAENWAEMISYDLHGNLVSRLLREFVFDHQNHLCETANVKGTTILTVTRGRMWALQKTQANFVMIV